MALLIDKRAQLQGQPGLHAMIVGVSAYPHLPKGQQPDTTYSLGMRQLSAAALTAFKFYRWLMSRGDHLAIPLATCRLLVQPSDIEQATEAELSTLAEPCSTDRFLSEVHAWRQDAATHPDNVTMFYFAGHGIQQNKNDAVMLMEGFGDGIGGALRHGIDIKNLFAGMAPTPARPNIAQTQFYFIDACRNLPDAFRNLAQLGTSDVFSVELSGRDDRRAPIFFAAIPGSYAYAHKGEQTVFSKALLHCLNTATDDPVENEQGNLRWIVTVHSLNSALVHHFATLNPSERKDQDFTLGGMVRDAVIHTLDKPPQVPVEIIIQPGAALQVAKLTVKNDRGQIEHALPKPLPQHPFALNLPAGTYGLVATIEPPTAPFQNYERWRPVMPPGLSWKVKVGP